MKEVQSYAEAAVVGSAVVHAIEDRFAKEGAEAIEKFVRRLKDGRRGAIRMSDVAEWRKRIDEIDQELVKLLNERSRARWKSGTSRRR